MSYLADLEAVKELKKTILKAGDEGNPTIKRFDKLKVLFKLTTGGQLVEEALDPEKPYEVKVGDLELMKGMNYAFTTMKAGEKAVFEIPPELMVVAKSDAEKQAEENLKKQKEKSVQRDLEPITEVQESKTSDTKPGVGNEDDDDLPPPLEDKEPEANALDDQPSILEVEILEVDSTAKITKWDLEDEEKLDFATKCKEKGNELLKASKLEEADKMYEQCIEIVEWDKSPRRLLLKVQTLYNLTRSLSKQKRFVSALEKANWAVSLMPALAKGYFRRAEVYRDMGDYGKSLEDLKKAEVLEPQNREVKEEREKVQQEYLEYRKKNKDMYEKMLGKGIYDSKRPTHYHDVSNKRMSFEMRRDERVVSLEIELLEHLMPKACKKFAELRLDGSTLKIEKKENYLLFETGNEDQDQEQMGKPMTKAKVEPKTEEKADETSQEILPGKPQEKPALNMTEAGMLFFPAEADSSETEFGISLAPLPWYDGKWHPFAVILKPVDFELQVKMLLQGNEASKSSQTILYNFKRI